MTTLVYDSSFYGLLTAVFEAFDQALTQVQLATPEQPGHLFGNRKEVATNQQKAARVWKGLLRYIAPEAREQLYQAWLSEQEQIPQQLFRYMHYVFTSKAAVDKDYSNPAILAIAQTARQVHREKHRMEAFVRFQLTADQLYYATVEPDFNVLPLITAHFEKRYADQRWLIYDVRRKYGIYYDLNEVAVVDIGFHSFLQQGKAIDGIYDKKEERYQQLWQQYFTSTNIAARKNTALHLRHMPLRYWKYLTEKQPG